MSDERPGSAGQPPGGSGRKKRPAPTIDLTAAEIGQEAASAPAEPPRERARAAAAEMIRAAEEAEAAEPSTTTLDSADEAIVSPGDEPGEHAAETLAATPGSFWASAASRLSGMMPETPWPSLGAGAAGALVMLLGLWLFGVFADDEGAGVVENRVIRLEAQIRDLARAQTAIADPRRSDELTARVARLEAMPPPVAGAAQADPAIENRLGTAEEILKAVDQNVADLHRRADEINTALRELRERVGANTASLADLTRRTAQQGNADRSEVDAVGSRIAAAETALRAVQADLAKLAAGTPDRTARLAVAAAGLRAAVERGDGFAAELAAVKALGADMRALAPLESFAASGVPSAAALGREFVALSPELQRSAGTTVGQSGGILDRLQANAEKLVRIRPVDEAPGDDARAIVSRADARASQGDLAGLLAELARLPAPVRAQAEPWIRKVEARNAALEAVRRFATDALTAVQTTR